MKSKKEKVTELLFYHIKENLLRQEKILIIRDQQRFNELFDEIVYIARTDLVFMQSFKNQKLEDVLGKGLINLAATNIKKYSSADIAAQIKQKTKLETIDAIAITSANAAFALKELDLKKEIKVFAIGSKTAEKCRELGFLNIILPAQNNAEALCAAIKNQYFQDFNSENSKEITGGELNLLYLRGLQTYFDLRNCLESINSTDKNIAGKASQLEESKQLSVSRLKKQSINVEEIITYQQIPNQNFNQQFKQVFKKDGREIFSKSDSKKLSKIVVFSQLSLEIILLELRACLQNNCLDLQANLDESQATISKKYRDNSSKFCEESRLKEAHSGENDQSAKFSLKTGSRACFKISSVEENFSLLSKQDSSRIEARNFKTSSSKENLANIDIGTEILCPNQKSVDFAAQFGFFARCFFED